MVRLAALGWVFCLLLCGCAGTLKVQPVKGPEQTTVFKGGVEAIISKNTSIVAIRHISNFYRTGQRPCFIVSVFNGTGEPFDFSTENITAAIDGSPLKVLSYEDLVAEMERQRRMAMAAAAFAGAAQSMNAAMAANQYHYGTYSANDYGGGGGYGSSYGTYSGYTYNPAAAAQAQALANAQTVQNMEGIHNASTAAMYDLGRRILRKETVQPNTWSGGQFEIQKTPVPDSSNAISIRITFAGEEHTFEFTQTRVE